MKRRTIVLMFALSLGLTQVLCQVVDLQKNSEKHNLLMFLAKKGCVTCRLIRRRGFRGSHGRRLALLVWGLHLLLVVFRPNHPHPRRLHLLTL